MSVLNQNNRRWTLVLAFIIGIVAILPNSVNALPQQAITLLYFRGTGQNNAIFLEWATATEFETAGFIIQRANSENGPYIDLDQIGFIPGEGDGIIGAEYEVTDTMNVVNGQTYWYILIEIETNGNQNPTDPISVIGGVQTATATPSHTPTAQATTNGQATATPSRTPTPTSTTQATSQSSSTTVPTSTQAASQATTQTDSSAQATPTATTSSSSTSSTSGTTSSTSGGSNVAQASSPNDPYPVEGSPSPTFVPDPNQINATEPAAYPAEGEGIKNEPYPAGTSPTETPAIQPQGDGDTRPLSTQPPLNPPPEENSESQPESSNTLFLWVGFVAALLIFAGGIIGSIFLFTRRSNQK